MVEKHPDVKEPGPIRIKGKNEDNGCGAKRLYRIS